MLCSKQNANIGNMNAYNSTRYVRLDQPEYVGHGSDRAVPSDYPRRIGRPLTRATPDHGSIYGPHATAGSEREVVALD